MVSSSLRRSPRPQASVVRSVAGASPCPRESGGAPQPRGQFQADSSWISIRSRGGALDDVQDEIYANSLIKEEWESELEFEGNIELMEGQTDSDPEEILGDF